MRTVTRHDRNFKGGESEEGGQEVIAWRPEEVGKKRKSLSGERVLEGKKKRCRTVPSYQSRNAVREVTRV